MSIRVGSIVVLWAFHELALKGEGKAPPVMIVAGLKPDHAKCIWYNTRLELQWETIRKDQLTEV